MRLGFLSVLALAMGQISCSSPVLGPQLLNQTGEIAKTVLAQTHSFDGFTADDATRLVQACEELKYRSPDDWQRYCQNNPAYQWAKQNSPPEPNQPGGGSPGAPTETRRPANDVRLKEDIHPKEQVAALIAEVKSASLSWGRNAAAGNLEARVLDTSKLKVLFADLQECAGSAASVLPESPLGLLPPGDLLTAADELSGRRRQLQDLSALFGDPLVEKSIETLDAQVRELRAVAGSPRTGTFHRSRDQLAPKLSESKAKELLGSRAKRLEAFWRRELAVLQAQYPASELDLLAQVPPDPAKLTAALRGLREAGFRAFDVVGSYGPKREAWLRSTSTLMAEHATIFANAKQRPEFHAWWASGLPNDQLAPAVAYARAMIVPEHELGSSSMDPNGEMRGYISGFLPALESEAARRKAGGKRNVTVGQIVPDTALVDQFAVRLSLTRWGSLGTMPPAIRETAVVAIEREERARDQEALSLHARMIDLERKVESQPAALQVDLRQHIREARNRLLVLLSIREQTQKAREKLGYHQRSPDEDKFSAILASLRLDPPDSDLVTAVRPAPPKDPSGGSGGASARGPPEFSLRDPRLISARVQLSESLDALQAATNQLPKPVYGFASEVGRRNMSREDALIPKPGSQQVITISQESRRPETLQTWNGWLDKNGAPLSAEDVKSGKFLRSIPGGIVMVSTAQVKTDKDLSSFVLTYDWKGGRLALLGPRGEAYYSDRIEAQAVKAINAFVASGQTVAASIGWSGKSDDMDRSKGDAVLLDPAFVDTAVGQDLVRADSIPWEFGRKTFGTKTSGTWVNPMAADFKAAYDRWRGSLSTNLAAYLLRNHVDPSERAEQLRDLRKNKDLFQQKLHGCVVEPKILSLLVELFQKENTRISRDDLLSAVDYQVFRRKTLATLYDDKASFGLSAGKITLDSELDYRYVTSTIVYGQDGVRFAECLEGRDEVTHIKELEETVNPNVARIAANFPSIKNVRDYGRIAALLRWAREPKHVLAVDFYSLARVSGHDAKNTPTPDMIVP